VEDMTTLAQVIGSNTVSAMQFLDEEAAANILMELRRGNPDILQAGILDKEGKVFARYAKPGSDSVNIFTLLSNKNSLFRDNHLYVKNDIVNGNELIGKIFLEVALTELNELKKSKFESAALLLLFALGFSILLAVILQTYISNRLLSLVDTMKEVGRTGDYNKSITDDGKDEISVLVQGFDQLMQKIKENLQRKDEFIGIASHELKTPITSLKGYLELLKQMEDRPLNKQFVEKALNNVGKLEKLIRDLLDVSKIHGGQLELNPGEFNMGTLMEECIAAVQLSTHTHTIIREDDLNETLVVADRQRIEQVIINL
jgi:signal transduction histidine kinase